MRFAKYQGAGNDFVIVEARDLNLPWDDLALRMCTRRFGIGADGLILVVAGESSLTMRVFNPDGSEAEACGNGLRCFARYAVDHSLVREHTFKVETLGGVRHVEVLRSADGRVGEIEVSMGEPRFAPEDIPAIVDADVVPVLGLPLQVLDTEVVVNLISMGNPHAVTFVSESVDGYPLDHVGPLMEQHRVFPRRVNFEAARVLNREEVEARVWERGAGETLACGSGACAIAVAAQLLGYCDQQVGVHLPGGLLTVTWPGGAGEVWLRGPAVRVFEGDWPD